MTAVGVGHRGKGVRLRRHRAGGVGVGRDAVARRGDADQVLAGGVVPYVVTLSWSGPSVDGADPAIGVVRAGAAGRLEWVRLVEQPAAL